MFIEDYGLSAKKLNLLLCNDAAKDKPLSISDLILSKLRHKGFYTRVLSHLYWLHHVSSHVISVPWHVSVFKFIIS